MNPGGYTNWPLLTGVTVLVHNTNQMSRYRLDPNPVDGQTLLIMCCAPAGQGSLNIHTGGGGPTFHANSTGYYNSVQCNLGTVGTSTFHVTWIDSLDQWLLV